MLSSYGLVMEEVEEVERPHINYTKNMSAWKKAGISINKYFAISAKTVTKALKPELETKAARRYITEVNVQQIKNGETVKVTDLTSGKDLTL